MDKNRALTQKRNAFHFRVGTLWARNQEGEIRSQFAWLLTWAFPVVGTGVDPVTSRFSGRISPLRGPCGHAGEISEFPGKPPQESSHQWFSDVRCLALFLIRWGTLGARSFTSLKQRIPTRRRQTGCPSPHLWARRLLI